MFDRLQSRIVRRLKLSNNSPKSIFTPSEISLTPQSKIHESMNQVSTTSRILVDGSKIGKERVFCSASLKTAKIPKNLLQVSSDFNAELIQVKLLERVQDDYVNQRRR